MTREALSGDELNHALAAVIGWEQDPPETGSWFDGVSCVQFGSRLVFTTSIDALVDGPERVLRERGAWEIVASWFRTSEGVEFFEATTDMVFAGPFVGRGATEAEARARAALSALSALNNRSADVVTGQ